MDLKEINNSDDLGNYDSYEQHEHKLAAKLFDFDEVSDFCKSHKVEVILDSSLNYLCYIDYKDGDRAYGDSLFNPLLAMAVGIKNYKKTNNNKE